MKLVCAAARRRQGARASSAIGHDVAERARRTTATPRRARRSAPTTVVFVGAAGSEYGDPRVRDGVPRRGSARRGRARSGRFPPDRHRPGVGARRASSAAASVWTPATDRCRRRTRSTSAPARRRRLSLRPYDPAPGSNPPRRLGSIAVDLAHAGSMKWWQQQIVAQPVGRTTPSQPPLVYTAARPAARRTRVVSVATMEGVWFAYDAAHRQADLTSA